jgi:hypothetical protein
MRRGTRTVGRRLLLLAVFEVVGILIIGWATFGPFEAPSTPANGAAYALVTVHLIVGAGYWIAKLGQIRRRSALPAMAHVLEPIRRALLAGLAIGAVIIATSVATEPPSSWLASVPLWLLATAEHVNYFHWQLMYDNRADVRRLLRTGFMRPHLRADALSAHRPPEPDPWVERGRR